MAGIWRNTSSVVIVARAALLGTVLLGTSLLGCPLYDEDCLDNPGCARGFQCDRFSRRCVPIIELPTCSRPEQCAAAETCTPDLVCRPGSCDFYGCVGGFTCGVVGGAHACVPSAEDAGGDAMAAPVAADAGSGGDASPNNPPILSEAGAEPLDASSLSDAATDASP
jgi:hypothetical protein